MENSPAVDAIRLINRSNGIVSGRKIAIEFSPRLKNFYRKIHSYPGKVILEGVQDSLPKDFIEICLALIKETLRICDLELDVCIWPESEKDRIKAMLHRIEGEIVPSIERNVEGGNLSRASVDLFIIIDAFEDNELVL